MPRPSHAQRQALDVLAELRRGGCRVLSASLLPSPAVRVDRAPQGVAPIAVDHAPARTCLQQVGALGGIRITWPVPTTPR